MSGEKTFRVPGELSGERLDRTLAELLQLPRTRCKELVQDGRVAVDGAVERRPATPVHADQVLAVELVLRDRSHAGAPEGSVPTVLWEDEHLVAVSKPAPMVVHPSPTVRGGTVSEWAEARYGALPDLHGTDRPGIIHRLDAETSGVLVLARTSEAGADLLRQFRGREVGKHYLAIVHGEPRFDSDWIEAPLSRAAGQSDRVSVAAPASARRQDDEDTDEPDTVEEGRPAQTFYRTLERHGDFALLACEPRTGRTHQIRVHLEWIDHPVVADKLYRGRHPRPVPKDAPGLGRHALHAQRLELRHPVTGEALTFEAPLTPDLERFLAWLRKRSDAHGS